MTVKRHIYKNASIYLIFSVLNFLIGFFSVTYVSKLLSPAELGNVGILLSVLYVAMTVVSFSATGLVNIKQATEELDQYVIFRQVYLLIMLLLTVFALVGTYIISNNFIYIEAIILCFFRLVSTVHTQELVFKEHSVKCGLLQVGTNLSALLLTIFLISYMDLSFQGRILAWIFSEVLFFMVRVGFVKLYAINVSWPDRATLYKEVDSIIRFGFPLVLGSGAGWLLYHSDKFILLHFFNMEVVGVFTVAFSYGGIILLFGNAILNAFKKHIYLALNEKKYEKSQRYLHEVSLIVFMASVALILFLNLAHTIILNHEYIEHFHTIQILVIAYCIQAIAVVYGSVLEFYRKSSLRTVLYFGVAFLYLILSMLIYKNTGINEDAFALGFLVAHIALLFLNFFYSRKVMAEMIS